MTAKEKQAAKIHEYEMAPVQVSIPGFALHALADKAQEWADIFDAKGNTEAAHKWYVVTRQLATAANNYTAEKPL